MASELPGWILNASREDIIECQQEGISHISLVGCLKYQSRPLKRDPARGMTSPALEQAKHKACRGCHYHLKPWLKRKLAQQLRSGWEFEGAPKWRPRSGFVSSVGTGSGGKQRYIQETARAVALRYCQTLMSEF